MAQSKGERADDGAAPIRGSEESRRRSTPEREGAQGRLEKLKAKLKRLREEDPNIYPLF